MKAFYTFALAITTVLSHAQTIQTMNNNTFSPNEVTIELGNSVTFIVTALHTATQVSEATWNANGNTPLSGGFNYSPGTHEYTPTEVGTIYFVCTPHSGMGMKGKIIVESETGISDASSAEIFRAFPNPATDELVIENAGNGNEFLMIDVQGREVLRKIVSGNERINVTQLMEGNYTAILRGMSGEVIGTQRVTIAR